MVEKGRLQQVLWVRSAKRDFVKFPEAVRDSFGFALYLAQLGEHPSIAKTLKGFGHSGVVELIEDHRGDTFRAVYTVRFRGAIYVLHAFQKKSKSGAKTAKSDIDLIKQRLRDAEADYKQRSPKE
jgi:phage-related protein